MERKKLAVIFGGNSTEYEVSLQSVSSVLEYISKDKYDVIPIEITRNGEWYRYAGEQSKIANNTWHEDNKNLHPVVVSTNGFVKGFLELTANGYRVIEADLAFPILHGKNREDGTVQGLLELEGIPVVGCGTLSSALCMDKDRLHKLVKLAGISVPKSVTFNRLGKEAALREIRADLSYPLFVKPVGAGSSFGITKVAREQELWDAIEWYVAASGRLWQRGMGLVMKD